MKNCERGEEELQMSGANRRAPCSLDLWQPLQPYTDKDDCFMGARPAGLSALARMSAHSVGTFLFTEALAELSLTTSRTHINESHSCPGLFKKSDGCVCVCGSLVDGTATRLSAPSCRPPKLPSSPEMSRTVKTSYLRKWTGVYSFEGVVARGKVPQHL